MLGVINLIKKSEPMLIVQRNIFFFLTFALCLVGCKQDKVVVEDIIYTEDDVGFERMKGVEILYSDSALLQVRITAPTMLRYVDRQGEQEFPDGLLVEFFDNNKRKTGQLSAKYGMRYEAEDKVVVQDSVVWKSNSGEQLDSEELIWEERNERIYTNKFVTVTRPDEIIFGYGFEADQNFTRTRIKAIDGVIKVDNLQ